MIDLVQHHLRDDESAPAREEADFAGARIDDDELRDAASEDDQRRAQARARQADATRSNLGLGHDIRAGLLQPTEAQLLALRQIVCRLLVRDYRELIAYGAGWTDPDRQEPVGDTGRHEPRHPDAITDAELECALADPDPLRGIAQLTARLGAAFTLDPAGVTRTKALGTERIARKLRDALPGGDSALRTAVWEFMRPMLSPGLAALNHDAFVLDDTYATTVDSRPTAPRQTSTTSTSTSSTAQPCSPHTRSFLPPNPGHRAGGPRPRRASAFSFFLSWSVQHTR
jgi:hypothetical protein